jgi:hypothetical protein
MRPLSGAIMVAGAMIGLGLTAIAFGIRYQGMKDVDAHQVHIGATSMMVVLVVLLAGLLSALGVAFLGLAYHHERRLRELGQLPATRTVP